MQGWVRDTGVPDACHVQVMFAGEVVAEAIACLFRQDVLHGGYGHGHHGFAARLRRPLPAGPGALVMHLPVQDTAAQMALDIPVLDPPLPERVEDMLVRPPGWTAADVAAHPGCLHLEANLASMGPARFADAVFRFAFGRWPSAAERRMNADSLVAGRITPSDLLLECLGSRERREMAADLPGPFDAAFPFVLGAQDETQGDFQGGAA